MNELAERLIFELRAANEAHDKPKAERIRKRFRQLGIRLEELEHGTRWVIE